MLVSFVQANRNRLVCGKSTFRKIERSFSLPCETNFPVESVFFTDTFMHGKSDATDFKITKQLNHHKKKKKMSPIRKEQKIEIQPKIIDEQFKKMDREIQKEKKKKWRNVDPTDMGFNLTLFPRHTVTPMDDDEVYAILDKIDRDCVEMEERLSTFKNVERLEGNNISDKYLRADRHRKMRKAHRQVKDKYCRDVTNNDGRQKLYVHHRVMKLARIAEKRAYLHYPSLTNMTVNKPDKLSTSKATTAARRRGAPAQDLEHALWNNNIPTDIPTELVSILINLQHRDLTPEDYDTLLRLDDTVAVKTISVSKLQSFITDVVDDRYAGDICSVCLDPYVLGQTRKFLPCGHCFHEGCIDMWLQNSSMNCPLDGLSVEE